MSRRPSIARCCAPLLLAAGVLAAPAAAAPPVGTLRGVPSPQLLEAAERALAEATAAVQAAPGWMGSTSSRQAALANGLAGMRRALAGVRAAWEGPDRARALPPALRRGSVALGALRVAWGRSGLAAPAAGRRLQALAASYEALRSRHGPEATRLGAGGALAPTEVARLARLQRARAGLADALRPLYGRAAAGGDRKLAAAIGRWIEQSERLAAAQPSLDALLAAVWLADQLEGEWSAAAPDLGPGETVDHAVRAVLGESEVGYLFVADLGSEGLRPEVEEGGAQVADGVELAVLGPAVAPAGDEGTPLGDEAALASETAEPIEWEGTWDGDGRFVEWQAGEEAWSDDAVEAESGPEGAEPPVAGESQVLDDAGGEPDREVGDAASFEVVTDSGEVLVVEVGPDGALKTKPKSSPQPSPAAAPPAPAPAPPAPAPMPPPL